MAGSRIEKIGTIFSRTTGLLKSGGMKESEKPLWYDIYEAFPPKYEPRFDRPALKKPILPIFYHEDAIRAKFYKKFASLETMNIFETKQRPTICKIFVDEYNKLKTFDETIDDDVLMEDVVSNLERRGIYLDRSRQPPKITSVSKALINDTEAELNSPEEQSSLDQVGLTEKVRLSDIFKINQDKDLK